MLVIRDGQALALALNTSLDPLLKRRLVTRRDQLLIDTEGGYDIGELAHFVIVEAGDTIADIETAADMPVITSALFEWVEQWEGIFEAVVVLSDDGFGIVLLTPDRDGIDPTLLKMLRDEAAHTAANAAFLANHGQPTAP